MKSTKLAKDICKELGAAQVIVICVESEGRIVLASYSENSKVRKASTPLFDAICSTIDAFSKTIRQIVKLK